MSSGIDGTFHRPYWLRPLAVVVVASVHGVALAGLMVKAPVEPTAHVQPVDLVRDVEPAAAKAGGDWSPASMLAAVLPEPDAPPPLEIRLPKLEDAIPPPIVEAPAAVIIPVPTPPPPQEAPPNRESEAQKPQRQPQPQPRRVVPAERPAQTAPPAASAPAPGSSPTGQETASRAGQGVGDVESAIARYAAQVHRLLQSRATALGLEHVSGTVALTFTIDSLGKVSSHAITQGSGDQHIDRAIQRLMTSTVFPPPPGGRFSGTVNIRVR